MDAKLRLRNKTIAEMENAMAYLTLCDYMRFFRCVSVAEYFEDELFERYDVDLQDESEHYCTMSEIAQEALVKLRVVKVR